MSRVFGGVLIATGLMVFALSVRGAPLAEATDDRPTPESRFEPAAQTQSQSQTRLYRVDPSATRAQFEVAFMGIIKVRGDFADVTGAIRFSPQHANNRIEATIAASSLKTRMVGASATDKILRGPGFFDVDQFPDIRFVSTQFQYDGERLTHVEGNLTLLGVTRPVTLAISDYRCPDTATTVAAGADPAVKADAVVQKSSGACVAKGGMRIRRSEFGMSGWKGSVGDEVAITIELNAVEETPANLAPLPQAAPESPDAEKLPDRKLSSEKTPEPPTPTH